MLIAYLSTAGKKECSLRPIVVRYGDDDDSEHELGRTIRQHCHSIGPPAVEELERSCVVRESESSIIIALNR